jgi:protein-tyrosine phosphatase
VRISFVCLGNICRSPTAHGLFAAQVKAAQLDGVILVDSAGTGDWHVGELPDRRARAEAASRGLTLDHRARQFVAEDFARFDLVLAMDASNEADLRAMAPTTADRDKVRLFRSFDPASPQGAAPAVPDPYYGGPDGFREVFDICEAASRGLLTYVRETYGL